MTTYVLGWDGLDARLCEEFGLSGEFAPFDRGIESLENPVLGKPDTYEMWPSMITGTEPDVHGVQLIDDDVGASFDSRLLSYGAETVHKVLPTDARVWIGLKLRNMGFSLSQKTPEWYRERGVPTVFDGRDSRAITVPNYVTEEDEDVGLEIGWNSKHAEMLHADAELREERVVYRPKKPPERIDEWLLAESSEKIGAVLSAADEDYDLVFAWLPYLDTIGHTVPAVDRDFDEPEWQERAYNKAAALTDTVREFMEEDDELVVVSDHGNRDGRHTMDAYIASTDAEAIEDAETALDLKDVIDRTFEASEGEATATGTTQAMEEATAEAQEEPPAGSGETDSGTVEATDD